MRRWGLCFVAALAGVACSSQAFVDAPRTMPANDASTPPSDAGVVDSMSTAPDASLACSDAVFCADFDLGEYDAGWTWAAAQGGDYSSFSIDTSAPFSGSGALRVDVPSGDHTYLLGKEVSPMDDALTIAFAVRLEDLPLGGDARIGIFKAVFGTEPNGFIVEVTDEGTLALKEGPAFSYSELGKLATKTWTSFVVRIAAGHRSATFEVQGTKIDRTFTSLTPQAFTALQLGPFYTDGNTRATTMRFDEVRIRR